MTRPTERRGDAPRLDDTEDRVTGWCRNPTACADPDCACLALRREPS